MVMTKKFEVLPPIMPNFVRFKKNTERKQDGPMVHMEGIPIKNFTREEAEQYAELMKETFMKPWEAKQKD